MLLNDCVRAWRRATGEGAGARCMLVLALLRLRVAALTLLLLTREGVMLSIDVLVLLDRNGLRLLHDAAAAVKLLTLLITKIGLMLEGLRGDQRWVRST